MTETLLPQTTTTRSFALDRASREAGRRGVANARAQLAAVRSRRSGDDDAAPHDEGHSVAA